MSTLSQKLQLKSAFVGLSCFTDISDDQSQLNLPCKLDRVPLHPSSILQHGIRFEILKIKMFLRDCWKPILNLQIAFK